MEKKNLSQKLNDNYSNYKFSSIENKRFSHSDLMEALNQFISSEIIEITTAGHSVEGRDIKLIKIGNGKTNVMVWSQMHGDESTATMALLDFLNFIEDSNNFTNLRNDLLQKITLYIIPMLNPDGAERFQRKNELNVDLNRDALRLQFPESKTLKKIQEMIRPQFAFNMHDQSTRYTVGNSNKVAAISFLAPAYNYEKEINDVRKNAMRVISNLITNLEQFIPGHIAKYNDAFEPRAFGDNFVKWGSSLILLETGGWKNNYEKLFLRKLNFIALISGFESIANENYKSEAIEIYQNIPENQERLFDLLLRNVTIRKNNQKFIVDIGINHIETGTNDKRNFYLKGIIEDIGDLSIFVGLDEMDCKGLTIATPLVYYEKFKNFDDFKKSNIISLLEKGYSFIQGDYTEISEEYSKIPINITSSGNIEKGEIGIGKIANFRLLENGTLRFVFVNGFPFDINSGENNIPNGLILK